MMKIKESILIDRHLIYIYRPNHIVCGHMQMAIDGTILAIAFILIEPQKVLYLIVGAVMMNFFIVINHRPGRYAVL